MDARGRLIEALANAEGALQELRGEVLNCDDRNETQRYVAAELLLLMVVDVRRVQAEAIRMFPRIVERAETN